ncbi:MAG: glycosyltransferase family 4 protein [Ignavibacteriales bacterium]|nr:glycosyltransferase family 4 protein [Ignavibacteriales bacterium]
MKVVHIINADTRGGAPKAAFAIHKALLGAGVDSKMLVQRKFSNDEKVASYNSGFLQTQLTNSRMLLDIIQMKLFTQTEKGRFSFASVGKDISNHRIINEADVLHLHWINEGYLSLESLRKLAQLGKPIVWTLHDMWAFTGGCHYSAGCKKYEESCGKCPYLKTPNENDYSKKIWRKKLEIYNHLNPSIVTCSNWMGECAKKSSLLNKSSISVIPNPIDIAVYKPINKSEARKRLNLSPEKNFVLFGTLNVNEERKGFKQLVDALELLIHKNPEIVNEVELLVYGSAPREDLNLLPLKANGFGRITNEEILVDCYNSADVFVAPSLEDNLPNTVMESLACGVPVAAFNIGGMPDMIEHLKTGYLAQPFSTENLSEGIKWLIEDEQRLKSLNEISRKKVMESFTSEIVGLAYFNLYKSLSNSI